MEGNNASGIYETRQAKASELPDILNLLRDNFDQEETMIKSLRSECPAFTKQEEELMSLDLARLITAITGIMPAIVAVDEHGKIVGVNVMILSQRPDASNGKSDGVSGMFTANAPRTPLIQRYFRYLTEIGDNADLFNRFPRAKAALEFYAIAVDKDHRGKGLCRMLMNAGILSARSNPDIGFAFGVYTSLYSKKAAEKLGLRSCMDVDLLEYKDSTGRPMFQDTPPHNVVSVMVLEL